MAMRRATSTTLTAAAAQFKFNFKMANQVRHLSDNNQLNKDNNNAILDELKKLHTTQAELKTEFKKEIKKVQQMLEETANLNQRNYWMIRDGLDRKIDEMQQQMLHHNQVYAELKTEIKKIQELMEDTANLNWMNYWMIRDGIDRKYKPKPFQQMNIREKVSYKYEGHGNKVANMFINAICIVTYANWVKKAVEEQDDTILEKLKKMIKQQVDEEE